MSLTKDPLSDALDTVDEPDSANGQATLDTRDRLSFATGQMLSADDFQAEQGYHRGRLARALLALHGSGTVAGLHVDRTAATATAPEQLTVQPGIAIDRLGRLIELPRQACFRLNDWYTQQVQQAPSALINAFHPAAPYNGVVADVFIRFVVCPNGLTPAFASGPFDALDAVAPSRLRDAYELQLILRQEQTTAANPILPLPRNNWPDLSTLTTPDARRTALHQAIFNAWPTNQAGSDASPEPLAEYVANQDRSSVFLARVIIAATRTGAAPPQRTGAVTIDNDSRLFVYRDRALARVSAL
jgi:hypothetical protein